MDGAPLGKGGLVTCWRNGYTPDQLVDDPATIPPWKVVPTDSTGFFTISGLDSRARYTLTALGPWAVMSQPLDAVAPGNGSHVLKVSPLYGLDIVVSGPSGEAPHVDSQLGSSAVTVDTRAGLTVDPRRPELALLGLGFGVDPQEGRVKRLLYTAPARLSGVGPFNVAFAWPGYRSVERDVLVPRLSGATLPVEHIEVAPETMAFGAMHIMLLGVAVTASPLRARDAAGFIRLRDASGDSPSPRPWLCAVAPGQRDVWLETVPAGPWEVSWLPSVRVPGVTVLNEPVPVIVGEAPAEVLLEAGPTGIIEIVIEESPDSLYTGSALFTLQHSGQASFSTVGFDAAPYLIDLVPPGSYEVTVMCPHPGGATGARSLPFLVSEGEVSPVKIPMPESAGQR